ncbi:MAG TPA: hypothetical protein VH120_18540 [Gemmataceae bacterium]|jgi:hypothetical protein|nr:hypothetical protein [Gemmataceae bacterium]
MSGPRLLLLAVVVAPLLFVAPASPQLLPRNRSQAGPKPEPIAETKLLMEGLLQANVRGLEKNLAQPPTDQDTWAFVRGQSLLIAETGNLLMLRPPRLEGQDAWLAAAAELREKATAIARSAAARDADGCRRGLVTLAGTCNRCHQTFRVKVQVTPFAPAP